MQYDDGPGGLGTLRLDRQPASAITKRAQVRGILEHLIETELNPGDAIPSERQPQWSPQPREITL